jgi:hypothetical protein
MPSEVVRKPPCGGYAQRRQRGSRYVAGVTADTPSGHSARLTVTTSLGAEPQVSPHPPGGYTSERLSLGRGGKVLWGQAMAANRTREIRLSGMRGGLAEP